MPDGWIKLHRVILDWKRFKEPPVLCLLIWLLLTAKNGKLTTSADEAAEATGLTVEQAREAMKRLVACGTVTVDKSQTTKSIITITKWSYYQGADKDVRPAVKPPEGVDTLVKAWCEGWASRRNGVAINRGKLAGRMKFIARTHGVQKTAEYIAKWFGPFRADYGISLFEHKIDGGDSSVVGQAGVESAVERQNAERRAKVLSEI